ncbi:unnamed protein product, partial [Musa banksii]
FLSLFSCFPVSGEKKGFPRLPPSLVLSIFSSYGEACSRPGRILCGFFGGLVGLFRGLRFQYV